MGLQGLPKPAEVRTKRFLAFPELAWEACYPYIFGVLIAFAILSYLSYSCKVPDDLWKRVYETTIGFASIMAGFVATLLGIMFSIRETKKIKGLVESGLFNPLKRYMLETVFTNLLLALVCVIGVFTGFKEMACAFVSTGIPMFWGFLFATSLATVFRVVYIMHKLL